MEAGIWATGRPIFLKSLKAAGVSDEIFHILSQIDELAALEKLSGSEIAQQLKKWIKTLKKLLAAIHEKSWHAHWKNEESL